MSGTFARRGAKNQSLLTNDSSGVSRYSQLATLFRRQITTGQWKNGQQIPTIVELSASHGVATATVRQAITVLAKENLVDRSRGRGTFVIHHPKDKLWCEIQSNWLGLLRSRRGTTIETLSEERAVAPPFVPQFAGRTAKNYCHLRRRHWRKGEAFLLAEIFIDESLMAGVPQESLAAKTGLQIISKIPGLRLAVLRQIVTIGVADVETAGTLEVELNAPVAFVRRYATNSKNRLVFSCESIYRGDVIWMSMKVDPNQTVLDA